MTNACTTPLSLDTLLAYWFGELGEEAERRAEEHFFACADCSANLEDVRALGAAVRSVFASGFITAIVSSALVERMKERGMKLREYPVEPGGTVNCTIAVQDDAVISRLKAPLAGATRVDVLRLDEAGTVRSRYTDVPFDATAGEVLVCPSAAALKAMPAYHETMRLLAIDAEGEHTLGDYVFDHTPG
jgi:hypothetical protein